MAGLLKEQTHYGFSTRQSEILPYYSSRNPRQYKEMRMYPSCWLGLNYIKLGLAKVPFIIECEDKDIEALTHKMFSMFWERMLVQALESLDYGWKAMEILYEKGSFQYEDQDENKKTFEGLLIKGAKGLDPETVDLLIEPNGNFNGFQQSTTIKLDAKSRKPLVFTNHFESGNFYGISALEPVYAHWYDANLNRQFHMRFLERMGVGIYKGIYPTGISTLNGTETDNQDLMTTILDNLLEGTTLAIPSDRDENGNQLWDVGVIDAGTDKTDYFLARARYIDETILWGLLIPEKALTQGEVGARSSIESFQSMFMVRKQAVLDNLVDIVDRLMLKNFIELNFGKNVTCHIKAGQLNDKSDIMANSVFEKLVDKGAVKVDKKWLMQKTGVPFEEDEPDPIPEPLLPGHIPEKEEPEKEKIPKTDKEVEKKVKKDESDVKMREGAFWRPFTLLEETFPLERVDFEMNSIVTHFQSDLEVELRKQITRINKFISKNINSMPRIELINSIEVNLNPFKKIVKQYVKEAYSNGLQLFVKEIQLKAIPFTTSDYIGLRVNLTSDKIQNSITGLIKELMSDMTTNSASEAEIIDGINKLGDDFADTKIPLYTETETSNALSQAGRDDFKNNQRIARQFGPDADLSGQYDRWEYSAILDSATCPLCRSLDGTIVRTDSSIYKRYQPPLHDRCRCVWLPITKGMVDDREKWEEENAGKPKKDRKSEPHDTNLAKGDNGRPLTARELNEKLGKKTKHHQKDFGGSGI